MNTVLTKKRLLLLAIVMVMSLGAVVPIRVEGGLVEGAMILAPVQPQGTENITDDLFTACLARIPAQATLQQRMLAEKKCQTEETARQLVPLVLKEGD
ncbi:MAG TPA: hypothetical protein VGK56_09870 [Anaerolineales bacterium]